MYKYAFFTELFTTIDSIDRHWRYGSYGETVPCDYHLEKIHILGKKHLRDHIEAFLHVWVHNGHDFSPTEMPESSREMAQKPLRDPPHFPSHDPPCTFPQLAALCSSASPSPSSPSCLWPPPSAGSTVEIPISFLAHLATIPEKEKYRFPRRRKTHHALLQAEHLDRPTLVELISYFQYFFAAFPSSADFCCDFLSFNFFLRSTLFNSLPRSLFMLPHLLS